MTTRFISIAAIAGLLGLAGAATAQQVPDDILRAELRSGWRTESGSQMMALHLTLAPGWKTYWRAPGEAGIPPHFDWQGSVNIAGVTPHWPAPQVYDVNGMRVIGYKDELVLPLEVMAGDLSQPVSARATVDLGVCDEICVPVRIAIAADPVPGAGPDPLIRAALSDQPKSAAAAGLSDLQCSAEPIRDGLRLTAGMRIPRVGPKEFAVIELGDRDVWVSSADTERTGDTLRATADLVPSNAQPFALDRSSIRITLFGGGSVLETIGCPG